MQTLACSFWVVTSGPMWTADKSGFRCELGSGLAPNAVWHNGYRIQSGNERGRSGGFAPVPCTGPCRRASMAGGVRERLGYPEHGMFLEVICLTGHQAVVPVMHPTEGFGDGRRHPGGGTPLAGTPVAGCLVPTRSDSGSLGPAVGPIVHRSGHASALSAGTRCIRVFHGPRLLQVALAGPVLSGGWTCLVPPSLDSRVGTKQNRLRQFM